MPRLLKNKDFELLYPLYIEMGKHLKVKQGAFESLFALTHDIANKSDFIAMGIFDGSKLTGFVTGYAITKNLFYFSGIYVTINNINVKKLIDFAFSTVQGLGYKGWEADCNDNINGILEKYGAKPMYTRYKKEF